MNEELASLVKNNVYDIVGGGHTPAGTSIIACKWVFKRKLLPHEAFRYKARLVIRRDL